MGSLNLRTTDSYLRKICGFIKFSVSCIRNWLSKDYYFAFRFLQTMKFLDVFVSVAALRHGKQRKNTEDEWKKNNFIVLNNKRSQQKIKDFEYKNTSKLL